MRENMERLRESDKELHDSISNEEQRQKDGVELIPSENYAFPEVLAALGSVFTNKYSEGYPGRRYYGGQENTDCIENLARARKKFVQLRSRQRPALVRVWDESSCLPWALIPEIQFSRWICLMEGTSPMVRPFRIWESFLILFDM